MCLESWAVSKAVAIATPSRSLALTGFSPLCLHCLLFSVHTRCPRSGLLPPVGPGRESAPRSQTLISIIRPIPTNSQMPRFLEISGQVGSQSSIVGSLIGVPAGSIILPVNTHVSRIDQFLRLNQWHSGGDANNDLNNEPDTTTPSAVIHRRFVAFPFRRRQDKSIGGGRLTLPPSTSTKTSQLEIQRVPIEHNTATIQETKNHPVNQATLEKSEQQKMPTNEPRSKTKTPCPPASQKKNRHSTKPLEIRTAQTCCAQNAAIAPWSACPGARCAPRRCRPSSPPLRTSPA